MTRVILYARFSPRPDAPECESVIRQLADLHEFAAKHGYEVVGEFKDEALSGASEDRPGLEEALKSLKRGQLLLVRSIDRLARGNALTEALLLQIAARGAHLQTMDGVGTLAETAEQELLRVLMQGIGQYQRRRIRETTSRRMKAHQASGRRMSDRLPFGWREDPSSPANESGKRSGILEDDQEQDVIRRIIAAHERGLGQREIARVLTEEGVLCRGRPWLHTTVRRILSRAGAFNRQLAK